MNKTNRISVVFFLSFFMGIILIAGHGIPAWDEEEDDLKTQLKQSIHLEALKIKVLPQKAFHIEMKPIRNLLEKVKLRQTVQIVLLNPKGQQIANLGRYSPVTSSGKTRFKSIPAFKGWYNGYIEKGTKGIVYTLAFLDLSNKIRASRSIPVVFY